MEETAPKKLLVIMVKEPQPGGVKTRLTPELTPHQAARIYQCFLQDRLEEMGHIKGIDLAVAYTPASAHNTFVTLVPKKFRLFPQQDVELGRRLQCILQEQKSIGYNTICIMDSDSPDLPKSYVIEAFNQLAAGKTDVVLGPCDDGGYYLIGMRHLHLDLLEEIPWSTENVLQTTIRKAKQAEIMVHILPQWHDIDTYQDLSNFCSRHCGKSPGPENWTGKRTFSYLIEKNIFSG